MCIQGEGLHPSRRPNTRSAAWRKPRIGLGSLRSAAQAEKVNHGRYRPIPVARRNRNHRFDEKQVFGEFCGLTLSLVQEESKEFSPLLLVLIGGADGFLPLQFFEPTP